MVAMTLSGAVAVPQVLQQACLLFSLEAAFCQLYMSLCVIEAISVLGLLLSCYAGVAAGLSAVEAGWQTAVARAWQEQLGLAQQPYG
jgi:hypothetical protein